MANTILTGTYIRSTFITAHTKLTYNFQNGKQIDKLLDMSKRPQAPKHIFWDWNMKHLETRFHILIFLRNMKNAHGNSVHNGSYAFPNELMRFRFEAKPIWEKIQKHCKHAVIN